MSVLVLLKADGSERVEQVFELAGTDLVIGRAEGVQIPIIDPTVSRQHARVVLHEGQWWAMTLNPQNPIRSGGQPVQQLRLTPGTVFAVGRLSLRWEEEDPRRSSTIIVDGGMATGPTMAAGPVGAWQLPSTPSAPAPAPEAAPSVAPAVDPRQAAAPVSARPAVRDEPRVVEAPPESGLRRASSWPWVIAFVLLAASAGAAYAFRTQIPGLASWFDGGDDPPPLPPPDLPPPDDAAGESSDAAAGEASSDTGGATPEPAQPACPELTGAPPAGSDLARVVKMNGYPDAFIYSRGPGATESRTQLVFAELGQVLDFAGLDYRGGAEGARGKASTANLQVVPWKLSDSLEPACVVAALGPARLAMGAYTLPAWPADGPVPVAWALAGGGFMVTSGDTLAMLMHAPSDAGFEREREPHWLGHASGALVTARHDGARWHVDVHRVEATEAHPAYSWVANGRADDTRLSRSAQDELLVFGPEGPGRSDGEVRMELAWDENGEQFELKIQSGAGSETLTGTRRDAFWEATR